MKAIYPTAFTSWGDEERDAIQDVIESDRYTSGPEVEAFEEELAAYSNRKHCIAVNSGSSANLIAIDALSVVGGDLLPDDVDVPALAWPTTYSPLIKNWRNLGLVDCDETWRAKCDDVAVSILGNPPVNGAVFHDCCESLGAYTSDGQPATSIGLVATTSFFWSHQLSAIEGGAVLTDDDEIAGICRRLRNHGGTRDKSGAWEFTHWGYNLRFTEMHAAVAREQLRKLDNGRTWRRINWDLFQTETDGLPIKHIKWEGSPNPFGLPFTVESPEVRKKLVAAFDAAWIDSRIPCGGSMRLHPYGASWRGYKTPNADKIHTTGIMLGNAPHDISGHIQMAAKVMRETL